MRYSTRPRLVLAVLALAVLGTAALSRASARTASAEPRPDPRNYFTTTVENAPGLVDASARPDHTLYRPTDRANVPFRMPVVLWANGGCRSSNQEFYYYLRNLASLGYFVIANGAADAPYLPGELAPLLVTGPQPAKLTAALDWAFRVNADSSSPFHGRLDTTRVAMMGQSCGGGEAAMASHDRRVRASILWNPIGCSTKNNYDVAPDPQCIRKLHAPTLWVTGGPGDFTAADNKPEYQQARVPAVRADNAVAGHTGLWDSDSTNGAAVTCCANGPVFLGGYSPTALQNEPLLISWRWLDATLYHRAESLRWFVGPACGLCQRDNWTVTSKTWSHYRAR